MTDNNIRALLKQALEALELRYAPDDILKIDAAKIAIRAELAKPATAPKASAFIRERAQLEQEWCVLKGTQQQYKDLPAWRDAPTCAGWWVRNSYEGIGVYSISEPAIKFLKGSAARWYGPICEDAAIAKAEGGAV